MKYFTSTRLSENMHETPEGFLVCIGVPIARIGDMVYGKGETPLETDSNGTVIITREESEVFRPETIASFEGKPVTIKHPEDFVDPKNWCDLAKGIVQNVRRGEGDFADSLIADLLIMDAIAIGLVKKGLREVSCGYEAEYHQTDEGKGTQSNIIGNHLALVEQGRAGEAYAINDRKGETKMKKKFGEKFKSFFATVDAEIAKIKDEEVGEEKKEESKDAQSYDELVKMVKDLGEKISAMAKPKDEAAPEKKDEEKKGEDEEEKKGEEKKSEDEPEVSASIEDRLKKLEMAVASMMEEESEEASDEDSDEEEIEDSDEEEQTMTGDTAARAEILAPGIKQTKDVKAKALKAAYGTKEGKKVIDALTGGRAPAFDSAEKVETLFVAASELLKASRSSEFSKSKQTRDSDAPITASSAVTAEQMNGIFAKHYGLKN